VTLGAPIKTNWKLTPDSEPLVIYPVIATTRKITKEYRLEDAGQLNSPAFNTFHELRSKLEEEFSIRENGIVPELNYVSINGEVII